MIEQLIGSFKIGQYKFKSIIEVFNLIVGLLGIESFCTMKFKRLLLPYFIKNKNLGLEVPLMFKVPKINDNVDGQNIYATR